MSTCGAVVLRLNPGDPLGAAVPSVRQGPDLRCLVYILRGVDTLKPQVVGPPDQPPGSSQLPVMVVTPDDGPIRETILLVRPGPAAVRASSQPTGLQNSPERFRPPNGHRMPQPLVGAVPPIEGFRKAGDLFESIFAANLDTFTRPIPDTSLSML